VNPDLYQSVKHSIRQLLAIDLDHYKDEQMQRRLESWLVRNGAGSWDAYFTRVKSEALERSRFRDYLTINVSSFFRDPERWAALRTVVLPELIRPSAPSQAPGGTLRVWSGGCSIGAEPYTLAMILETSFPKCRYQIRATDIDRGALATARAGGPYRAEDVENVPPAERAAFFEPGGPPYRMRSELGRAITFVEHDLVSSPFDANFDLIVCRNVVIYFTAETKVRLYRNFYDALRPGGCLFVGATEIILQAADVGFRSHNIGFYLKV
jgi:chemotaxis protein methyltransferase CheR